MRKSEEPIILNYQLNHSRKDVWRALVEHELMIQWYFDNIPEFKPEVGFQTSFPIHNEGRTFTHVWKVAEVKPLESISYYWSYPEYEGSALMTFKLSEKDQGTRLELDMKILEDFVADIPEFARESCVGGWNYFIDDRLRSFLGK